MKFIQTAHHGWVVFAVICLLSMSTSAQETAETTEVVSQDEDQALHHTENHPVSDVSTAWQTTFESGVLPVIIGNADVSIVVVASSGTESSSEAAQALIQALRKERTAFVMDDQWLGNSDELSDLMIVKRSAAQPVDQIVIVRVFSSLTGELDTTAIVSAFNKQGESLWSLVAKQGRALTPEQGVAHHEPEEKTPLTRAQKMYEARELALHRGFQSFVVSEGASDQHYYQSNRLSGTEFYETVGQPKLAAKFQRNETRNAWGNGLATVGTLGTLGFGIWSFTSWILSELNTDKVYNLRLPLSLTAGSLGVAILGSIIRPAQMHPVDIHHARKLVDDYNEDLRQEYGLQDDDETDLLEP